jgi:hypothetical protein
MRSVMPTAWPLQLKLDKSDGVVIGTWAATSTAQRLEAPQRLLRTRHKSRSRLSKVLAGIIGMVMAAPHPSSGNWRIMYVWARGTGGTRDSSALGMTPNCAQASLRKTARPVRCKLGQATESGYCLLDWLGPGAQDWHAACPPADCGKPQSVAGSKCTKMCTFA